MPLAKIIQIPDKRNKRVLLRELVAPRATPRLGQPVICTQDERQHVTIVKAVRPPPERVAVVYSTHIAREIALPFMEHKSDAGNGFTEEHKRNHRTRIVVKEIRHVWRSGSSLAAKRHAMRSGRCNKSFLQGQHGICRPCTRDWRVFVMLRVAEKPTAAKVLVKELAIVNTESGHLGDFVCDRTDRPFLCKTHVVPKLLSVMTVADCCGNLSLGSAHHVAAKVFVFETLLKGISRNDA